MRRAVGVEGRGVCVCVCVCVCVSLCGPRHHCTACICATVELQIPLPGYVTKELVPTLLMLFCPFFHGSLDTKSYAWKKKGLLGTL